MSAFGRSKYIPGGVFWSECAHPPLEAGRTGGIREYAGGLVSPRRPPESGGGSRSGVEYRGMGIDVFDEFAHCLDLPTFLFSK